MSDDIRKEARKQYFHYFRIWFIVTGVLLVITAVIGVKHAIESNVPRTNLSAPAERVYDYADVLTEEERAGLRQRIAEVEARLHIDIVLVTLNQPMAGEEAMRQYGYRSVEWDQNMMDYADDFWDENRYGYNKGFEGDGCVLVHNWYEGQSGAHLSPSGSVEARFGSSDIDDVLRAVAKYNKADPYKAYMAYIDEVYSLMSSAYGSQSTLFSLGAVIVLPLIAALGYAVTNLNQKKAKDTTTASTYVEGGKPVMREKADDFIRKSVVTRKIESGSSGSGGRGGGSSHSGGGGHHTSRSGASHGGGSRRF